MSALGRALSLGNNRSLQTLKLDYNDSIGHEGATLLARGLRTNSTLKVTIIYIQMKSMRSKMRLDV